MTLESSRTRKLPNSPPCFSHPQIVYFHVQFTAPFLFHQKLFCFSSPAVSSAGGVKNVALDCAKAAGAAKLNNEGATRLHLLFL